MFGDCEKKNYEFGPWTVDALKSHILQSKCFDEPNCNEKIRDVTRTYSQCEQCDLCRFESELELPQLPEMTFAENSLRLQYESNFGIEFTALGALKMVDSKNDVMKVAVAEAWRESRMDQLQIKEVIKPFDWTFTTHFKGTLLGNTESYKVCQTEERIDMEKLKVRERILFYDDIMLFEDELADNGTAHYSVKIRIMPSCFFILLRYFLRIDNVLVRIIDTRVYFEVGCKYLLREHVTKEEKIKNLDIGSSLLSNPQELWDHLPTVSFDYEKIEFW